MIIKGSLIVCTKEWEGNNNIVGKFGRVLNVIDGAYDQKYLQTEFFENIKGHGNYGKYGHCWTISEKIAKDVTKGVITNIVFPKEDGLG